MNSSDEAWVKTYIEYIFTPLRDTIYYWDRCYVKVKVYACSNTGDKIFEIYEVDRKLA